MTSLPEEQIDWSVFDQDPENTCLCRCGAEFRSHDKLVNVDGKLKYIIRKPCPGCGRHDNIQRLRTDPERFTIG